MYKQLEEVLNWPFIFCSNSGYYFFYLRLRYESRLCLSLKKPRFKWALLLISSRVSYCWFISLGHWTFKRKRLKQLPIHLSNYWWAGINIFVYSTVLVITEIHIFLFFFTSVLLLIMRSQPGSIAWIVTSTAAFYHCWSHMEHSALYTFDINIVWPYEICEFIWFDKRQRYVLFTHA